ncbi:DUF2569 family protein [Variovorax ureilyticus]|uniref:DUF2569 family protein n=1 Tax=Variovorax ureilyticus TaxID=1836198 RepID=UPI003BF48374
MIGVAFSICVGWTFFAKSKRAPKLYVAHMAFACTLYVLEDQLAQHLHHLIAPIFDSHDKLPSLNSILLLEAGLWTWYFQAAKRVKNTFTR